MSDYTRVINVLLISALAAIAPSSACQNSGGQILGPSGLDVGASVLDGGFKIIVTKTCEIPCETIEDCERFKVKYFDNGFAFAPEEITFAWKACENGVCIDVECVIDADCAENPYPDHGGMPCTKNQCAPPCPDGKCNDFRDKCVDGRCLRQPEIPDPDCEGSLCECFSNKDCPAWSACRDGNVCRPFQSVAYTNASGRSCETDTQCGYYYIEQDMLETGLSPAKLQLWSVCGELCALDGDFGYPCGDGFTCVQVADAAENGGWRTACLVDECTGESGCSPSLKECDSDSDCSGDDVCTWPWGYCRGVCLDVKCPSCAEWLAAHRTRSCISRETKVWLDGGIAEEVEVPINVRRPD